jgi:hypothetical protein
MTCKKFVIRSNKNCLKIYLKCDILEKLQCGVEICDNYIRFISEMLVIICLKNY